MGIWNRLVNGLNGFREGFLNADPQQQRHRALGWFDEFSLWEARQFRYELFWGFYQANTFRKLIHLWAPELKAAFGLYRDTRNIYNPVQRLVEFGVTHTWGGPLDLEAGDGQKVRSAIPIETQHEYLRPAIGKLWKDSKWQIKKAVATRWGVCLGDVALRAVDDPERGTVIIRPDHPGKYKWVKRNSAGEIVQYIFEEERYDPRSPNTANINPLIDPRSMLNTAIYTEEATVEGSEVVYKTYLNGALYDWRGNGTLPNTWTVPYPFIPLEIINHKDIGLPFGMAECHTLISKVFEVDDMASGLGDQIRKAIRAPKLIAGVKPKTDGSLDITYPQGTDATGDGVNPSPSRQSSAIFATPSPDVKVFDLTFPLDIAGVNAHIKSINEEIERDYPELQMDIWATGDPSGRALRVARQRSEEKVQERRPAYDAGLIAIMRNCLLYTSDAADE